MLQKRIERAFETMKNRRAARKTKEEKEALRLEKGDMGAMILSGLMVLVPVALIALLVMVAIPLLLVR